MQSATQEQVNQDCRSAAIGCIDCKKMVADVMVERLAPSWERRANLMTRPDDIQDIIRNGQNKASIVAQATMKEVNEAMKI